MVYNSSMKKLKNKKLELPKKGKKIGGVAQALANYFDVDVTLVRVVWVLLLLPGGFPGIVPYLLLWLVVPEEN